MLSRWVGGANPERCDGRGHFFAAAAVAIRRILVENARRKGSRKRGGDRIRQELHDDLPPNPPEPREDLLALDEALDKLSGLHPQAADLVQLRYFSELTLPEAAQTLGVSPRTAGRLWAYARAWLLWEVDGECGVDENI